MAFGQDNMADTRAIAAEAYTYGFPVVDSYRIMHDYWVNPDAREYKGPINTLQNTVRVYGPDDKSVQTPNSDTPYSSAWLDLRAEPIVLTLPPIEQGRYYSAQLIDAYTHNFEYLGTRTSGNGGGSFLMAGPGWSGDKPPGIQRVLRADTELVFALIRTQLIDADDLDNVRRIQAGYKVQPLSDFLGQPAPPAAAPIAFIAPLMPEQQRGSLDFFRVLNFMLQYCPPLADETETLARFAKIGVGPGLDFAADELSPETREAIQAGIGDAWRALAELQKDVDAGKVTSGQMFGTRKFLAGNYRFRFAAAVLGIYGNSREEAMYPVYFVDADGKPLDAKAANYTLRIAADQMPPVDAFWSLTMYGLPDRLLVSNPIQRYLINSPMLPGLLVDADGGITLHVQHASPGEEREANWLPAPAGPFFLVLRLYLPRTPALNGSWKQPALERVDAQ